MPAQTALDEPLRFKTDRSRLQTFIHSSYERAGTRTRAQTLLKLEDGWNSARVRRAFDVCRDSVLGVRACFADGGVDAVLRLKPRVYYRQAVSGSQQAHLIAVVSSPIPDRHDHRALRMPAGRAVELGFEETISPETIRALLKEMS